VVAVTHPIATTSLFPDHVMRTTAARAQVLGHEWAAEMPLRVHSRDIAPDGAPAWHPEFERWLTRSQRPPALGNNPALRTTRAFRQLRKVSKREYEVLLRVLLLGDSIAGVTRWLNERARANNIPLPPGRTVHYTRKEALGLFIAGLDWVDKHR
jgi:2-keto-3-deoxy-galactonokinase